MPCKKVHELYKRKNNDSIVFYSFIGITEQNWPFKDKQYLHVLTENLTDLVKSDKNDIKIVANS